MTDMQTLNVILSTAFLASCALSFTLLFILLRTRSTTRDMHAVLLQMEEELSSLSGDLDHHTQRATAQGARVAWLEARVRGTKSVVPTQVVAPSVPHIELASRSNISEKPSMTERRHRVLKLRQRGQDTPTIAATLGMTRGEVELILGLTAVAA